jgi:hypothetical protein
MTAAVLTTAFDVFLLYGIQYVKARKLSWLLIGTSHSADRLMNTELAD